MPRMGYARHHTGPPSCTPTDYSRLQKDLDRQGKALDKFGKKIEGHEQGLKGLKETLDEVQEGSDKATAAAGAASAAAVAAGKLAAEAGTRIGVAKDFVDRFWVLLAAVLVFFMQAGFPTRQDEGAERAQPTGVSAAPLVNKSERNPRLGWVAAKSD